MESNAHYRTVGLIVLILLAGLITAGIWLSVGFEKTGYKLYTVYMREGVSGLTHESLVKYNGVKVGTVKSISISKYDPKAVRIVIRVDENTPITENTYAMLVTQGITGSTFLGLGASPASVGSLKRRPHEPYPIISTQPSFYNQIESTIRELNEGIKKLLSDKNMKNFNVSLENLQKITDVIARNEENIDYAFNEIPKITNDMKKSIQKFTSMTSSIADASQQVTTTMKSGKEGFDKITRQAIPPAILFIQRLNTIADNIEQISKQIKQNPAVIIRGNTPPKPGPGEL